MKSIWYNPDKLFSYNKFLNIIIMERGCGKTFFSKKYVIKRFLKHGEQFAFLKMEGEDIKELCKNKGDKFFNSDLKNYFKDKIESFSTDDEEQSKQKHTYDLSSQAVRINGKIAGYLMPLSLWDRFKGTEYAKVVNIIVDEFLPANNKRLKFDPVESFCNMVETLFRLKTKGKIFLTANSMQSGSAILHQLKFPTIKNKQFGYYTNPIAVLHYGQANAEYKKLHAESISGQLSAYLGQGDVILNNYFEEDNFDYIKPHQKLGKVVVVHIVHLRDNESYRVEHSKELGFIVREDKNKMSYIKKRITFDNSVITNIIKKGDVGIKDRLQYALQNNLIKFENSYIKNIFLLTFSRV